VLICSAYLFQIAWEQSFDYFLIIYKKQFLSRFSILRDKWNVKLLQHYWKKIWHVNSSVKIHSLSPSDVWKLSSFFQLWKADLIYSELKMWLVIRTSFGVLPCILLRTTDGIYYLTEFTFWTGMLSCRHDRLRHLISIQSSSSLCFSPQGFCAVFFSCTLRDN